MLFTYRRVYVGRPFVCVCGEISGKMNVEFARRRGGKKKKKSAGSLSGTCTSHHAVNGNFVSVKELIVGFSRLLTAEFCMGGNTFNRKLKYSQVMLASLSITLAVGILTASILEIIIIKK